MQEQIHDILQSLPYKLILSKAKNCEYRKVQILKKEKNYQIEKYTQKQVFHENLDKEELEVYLLQELGTHFFRMNVWKSFPIKRHGIPCWDPESGFLERPSV